MEVIHGGGLRGDDTGVIGPKSTYCFNRNQSPKASSHGKSEDLMHMLVFLSSR